MPKVKTSRAAAKRFKKTGTGQLKRMKAYKSHILTKKSAKRKRNLRHACDEITSSINESVSGQDSGTDKDYVDKEGNILYSHEQRKTVVYHYHTIALSIYKHLVEDTYSSEVEKALLDTYYKQCDGDSEKMLTLIKDLFTDVARPLNMMGFEIYHEFKESLIFLLSQIPSEHCETKSQSS